MRGRHVDLSGQRKLRVSVWAVLLCGLTACVDSVSALADDRWLDDPQNDLHWREVWKWREMWAGVDASRDTALIYGGATVAPFGHIHEPGLRMRAATGYGLYRYKGDRSTTLTPDIQSFSAQTYFAEALIGYLDKWGPLTAKAFVGASTSAHLISPVDPENAVNGEDYGLKGVIELWLDIGSTGYAAVDMSWNTAHSIRSARSRVGARISRNISTGLEAWLDLDAQSDCDRGVRSSGDCARQFILESERTELIDYARTGAFLRYEWDGGEISASAGVSGGMFKNGGSSEPRPYGTINWIKQF